MGNHLPLLKGAEPPTFGPYNMLRPNACMPLGMEVSLGSGNFVLDGDPASPPQKGAEPPIFDLCLLRPVQTIRASALPGKTEKHKNCFVSLKCSIKALPEINQLLDFFSLFDSRLILTLLHDSLNLVINAFTSGLLWGMVQDKRSRERFRSWTVAHTMHQCTVFWVSYFAK